MIECMTITHAPPFTGPEPVTVPLRKVNYFFGTNGAGKTTLSRIIANAGKDKYPSCSLSWTGGDQQQALVLNRDFVDRNFGQLRGIFTLGEEQKGIQEQIEQRTQAINELNEKRARLKSTLEGDDGTGGKRGELETLKNEFTERVFTAKQRHPEFGEAFRGGRNDKNKFRDMLLRQQEQNAAELKPEDELKQRAAKLFGDTPTAIDSIPVVDGASLLDHEADSILQEKIIGKEDVDIAAMIKRLDNSDWVRQGRAFYARNDRTCPFCQQRTSEAFAQSLEAYFDDTYTNDLQAIDDLISNYATNAQRIQDAISELDGRSDLDEFLDRTTLANLKAAVDTAVQDNLTTLKHKKGAPSEIVSLTSLQQPLADLASLIAKTNKHVGEHNAMIANLADERKRLIAQIWKFVLHELETDLKQYDKRCTALEGAIGSLTQQIKGADDAIRSKREEIRELERRTTSIKPTAEAINATLAKFGFTGFRLAIASDNRSYSLQRPGGEPVEDSLSEGEKTFVVFLYFYHLVRGSFVATGVTADRIVVFDDPVSSLDSDVLFIVSTLIREVCAEAYAGTDAIKQVIVLTHNVYFHREVTFVRPGDKTADLQYALVRKAGDVSSVSVADKNPVSTSYQLLWDEVRRARNDAEVSCLENTLRRILEYYFKVLGGVSLDKLYEAFDGDDKLVCKSLLSWVNAGSHHILDPIFVVPSSISQDACLRVFEAIFVSQGHKAHYDMMING